MFASVNTLFIVVFCESALNVVCNTSVFSSWITFWLDDVYEMHVRIIDRTPSRRSGIAKTISGFCSPELRSSNPAKPDGGGSGIRTHETLAGLTVFKTVAIDHSAIPPCDILHRKAFVFCFLALEIQQHCCDSCPHPICHQVPSCIHISSNIRFRN